MIILIFFLGALAVSIIFLVDIPGELATYKHEGELAEKHEREDAARG